MRDGAEPVMSAYEGASHLAHSPTISIAWTYCPVSPDLINPACLGVQHGLIFPPSAVGYDEGQDVGRTARIATADYPITITVDAPRHVAWIYLGFTFRFQRITPDAGSWNRNSRERSGE